MFAKTFLIAKYLLSSGDEASAPKVKVNNSLKLALEFWRKCALLKKRLSVEW